MLGIEFKTKIKKRVKNIYTEVIAINLEYKSYTGFFQSRKIALQLKTMETWEDTSSTVTLVDK